MHKTVVAVLSLVVCTAVIAWPGIGLDASAPQAVAAIGPTLAIESSAVTCPETGEAEAVAAAPWMSTDSLFQPAPSWNCNGCVEGMTCTSSAQCGAPQGFCIANKCRCICDPGV